MQSLLNQIGYGEKRRKKNSSTTIQKKRCRSANAERIPGRSDFLNVIGKRRRKRKKSITSPVLRRKQRKEATMPSG